LLDLIGVRRRADVEAFRPAAEEQIAHAAADQIGDVLELTQPVQHLERVRIDVAPRDRVLGARNDPRLDHRPALYQRRCATIRSMDRTMFGAALAVVVVTASASAQDRSAPAAATIKDPLARARALYNERRFDAAI